MLTMSKRPNDSRRNYSEERWDDKFATPPSPSLWNSYNSNDRGYYESWPYEYSNNVHVPSTTRQSNDVNYRVNELDERRNLQTSYEDNRWVDDSYQRGAGAQPYYDPFEPLPISSPIVTRGSGQNPCWNNERNLNLGTISNLFDDPLSQDHVNEKDEEFSSTTTFRRKRQRKNSDASNTGNSVHFQAPKSRRKRPKGMPKRPLSAYNLFFRSERAKIIAAATESSNNKDNECASNKASQAFSKQNDCEACNKNPVESDTNDCSDKKDRNGKRTCAKSKKIPHGKISFEELGRLIGSRWKELSDEEKKEYQDTAAKESNRYSLEMEKFHKERNQNIKNLQMDSTKKEKSHIVENEKQNKSISQTTNESSSTSYKAENTPSTSSIELQKASKSESKSIDCHQPPYIWTDCTDSTTNQPISVILNDSDGNSKRYYLAYAAIQMSKECATQYLSTLSALGNTLNNESR